MGRGRPEAIRGGGRTLATAALWLVIAAWGCKGGGASSTPGTGGVGGAARGGQSGSTAGTSGAAGSAAGGSGGSGVAGAIGASGAGGSGGVAGGSGGSSGPDASADGAPDGGFGSPTAWVYNIVNANYVEVMRTAVSGGSTDITPISQDFYKAFGDDYDFLYLFAEVAGSAASGVSLIVHWDGTSGVGIGPAFDFPSVGSAARLKSLVVFGTLVNGTPYESGPTLHETLHHWSMYLDASFGFDTNSGHWGYASANGLQGGFNRDSVRCRTNGQAPTGTVPTCPAEANGRIKISTAPFSPCCSADIMPYGPIELYLMGLVPASQVPALWVMDDPVYEGPVFTDASTNIASMNFDVRSLHVVTMADIVVSAGVRPAATQTAFRGAFVLITAQPATDDQLGRIARWARRLSGEQHDPTTGVISFSDATGGRATMTTRLKP